MLGGCDGGGGVLCAGWWQGELWARGGGAALADAGDVRSYHLGAAAGRGQDRKDRVDRKPAMVREDQKYDT